MLMMGAMLLSGVMFTSCKDDDNDDDGNGGKIDPSTIAATNLIAYFPFESEGETVQKANNTITFSKKVGAATFVTGRRGKAFQGSTSESYLEYNVTAASPIHSMDEFTFAAWIKTPVTTSGAAAIFSLNGGDATMGSIKILQESQALGDSVDMKLYLYDSEGEWHGQELRKNKPQFLNDKWYHFVAVYNKTTSKMQFFANGVLVFEDSKYSGPKVGDAVQPPLGPVNLADDMTKIHFGAWPQQTTGTGVSDWMTYYKGMLDEFRIYNKALSAEEIKNLYDAEVSQINAE
jgi:hypothetical protein